MLPIAFGAKETTRPFFWPRALSFCTREAVLSIMLETRAMDPGRSSQWYLEDGLSLCCPWVVCSKLSTAVGAIAGVHHFFRHLVLKIKLESFIFSPVNGFVLCIQEGSTWSSNCTNYKCAKTALGAVILASGVVCPPFNDTECTKVCTLGEVSDNN